MLLTISRTNRSSPPIHHTVKPSTRKRHPSSLNDTQSRLFILFSFFFFLISLSLLIFSFYVIKNGQKLTENLNSLFNNRFEGNSTVERVKNSCKPESYEVIAETGGGKIAGKSFQLFDGEMNKFLGIRFGESTAGENRFRPPKAAPKKWSGVQEAFKYGPSCGQNRFNVLHKGALYAVGMPPPGEPLSEDCLFLNIWTPINRQPGTNRLKLPEDRKNLKNVMIFIYGGAFVVGTASNDDYDGSVIASLGDVIVVTFNYRVGSLGWFGMFDQHAPGNQGLLDQTLAIKWVSDNIEYFGGDREKVTLFGHSAGAISVGMHVTNPMSRQLFHRAILQSAATATANVMWENTGIDLAQEFAEQIGCYNATSALQREKAHSPKLVDTGNDHHESHDEHEDHDYHDHEHDHDDHHEEDETESHPRVAIHDGEEAAARFLRNSGEVMHCFRAQPLEKLLKAESMIVVEQRKLMAFLPRPYADSPVIPKNPNEAIIDEKNLGTKIHDILIGTVEDEGGLFLNSILPEKFNWTTPENLTNTEAISYLQQTLSWVPKPGPDFVINLLFNTSIEKEKLLKEMMDMLSAPSLTCPVVLFGEQFTRYSNRKAYYYHFTHQSSRKLWPQWFGINHGIELQYVFGKPLILPNLYKGYDIDLSREIIKIWTQFAKTGIPPLPQNVKSVDNKWPVYAREQHNIVELNPIKADIKHQVPLEEKCNKWRLTLEL